ncbi:MAG: hypothetical protein IKX54_01410 [Lachnospiraceae bacterium]|nr:hypothetical protein [Lachnospiraceae bacterium]
MQKKKLPIYIIGAISVALIATMVVMTFVIATGSFRLRQSKIVIQTSSSEKEYNGTPLRNEGWSLVSGKLLPGHRMEVKVTGEQTEIGSANNTAFVQVFDESGLEVTEKYNIEVVPGKLEVIRRKITVTSRSADKIYNATPLMNEEVYYDWGKLSSTHELKATDFRAVTDPGIYDNTFTAKIYDSEENDVTDNYDITYEYGKLTVRYGIVYLRSGSSEKEYDGTLLTNDQCEVISQRLKEGHHLEMKTVASALKVGTYSNTIYAVVYDENGVDVSEMYDIRKELGKLTITPRRLVIRTQDVTRDFYSQPITNDWSLVEGSLAPGETLTVKTTQQLGYGEAGSSRDNDVAYIYIQSEGKSEDVSSCYQITTICGRFTITGGY